MPRGRYSLEAAFTAKDKFARPLARMQNRFTRFTRMVRGGFDRINRTATGAATAVRRVALASAAIGLATAGIRKAREALASMANSAFDVEDELAKVSTVITPVGDVTKALTDTQKAAVKWSNKHKASAVEFLEANYNMASAGLDSAKAIAGTRSALRLATATMGDATTSGNLLATMYNNMGDKSRDVGKEMDRLTDILARTQAMFQIKDLGQLNEGLKMGTPSALQFGVSIEQLTTAIGALNSAGAQGSMAGTAFSATMRQMGKASKALKFEIAKTADGGVDFFATLGNIEKKYGSFADISDKMKAKFQQAFGDEGLRGVSLLLGKNKELVTSLQAVTESTGAAAAAEAKIEKTRRTALKVLDNRITNVKAALAEGVLPALDKMNPKIDKAVAGMSTWVDKNKELVGQKVGEALETIEENAGKIAMWAKRVGTGVGGIIAYTIAVKLLAGAIGLAETSAMVATKTYRGVARAVGFLTAAETRGAVVTGLSTAARWAKTAALVAGKVATTKITAAMVAEKAVQVGGTVVTWGRVAAQTAYNLVVGGGTKALALFRGAQALTTTSTVAATGAIGTATAGLGAFAVAAGVAAAAVGAIMLAMDQLDKLDKETSGLGFWGLAGEMWDHGTWDPAKALSDYQDEQARKKARDEGRTGPGSTEPQVVSPQERVARSIERSVHESRETQQHDIMLHDPTGRAEVKTPPKGGVKIQTARPSGAARG